MSRKKAAALPVPASLDEARALVESYVTAERQIAQAQLVAGQVIDQVKAERDALIGPISAENAQRFAALKAWWEAGGKSLAGKHRSAGLAGAVLGIRKTPPAVKFARGVKADAVLAWLGSIRWSEARRFWRTKTELDKQAIIKGVAADEHVAQVFEGKGVTVVQTDEFFIDCGES